MADISNNEKNRVGIEHVSSGNDLAIDAANAAHVKLVNNASESPTYSAGFAGLVPPAAATDVITITGSASKTIRITKIKFSVSTTAGSGLSFNVTLLKRSTANSGGTNTTATNVPHDSNDAAGTATVQGYTANPTVGTLVGIIRACRTQAVTQGADRTPVEWTFSESPAKALYLRGTAQVISLNFNGTTITGPVVGGYIEWVEE